MDLLGTLLGTLDLTGKGEPIYERIVHIVILDVYAGISLLSIEVLQGLIPALPVLVLYLRTFAL